MAHRDGTRLEDPIELNELTVRNRLYRAPLLECAGNDPEAVDRLIDDLEPAAAAGAGLIFQGATIVRENGGCAAPGMTRVHDPEFVERCSRLTERIEALGGALFIQLEHGGLRSMETWHAPYREDHPNLKQLAASQPPWQLRLLDRLGFLSFDVHILSTNEVYELARDFGEAAGRAVDAGYHGIHLAGANMGLIEQFCSPFYNRRTDEFGPDNDGLRTRFLEVLHDEIRAAVGHGIPVLTKIPAETGSPPMVRRYLDLEDGIALAKACESIGYDGVVPVTGTGFWDASIVRGSYPERAWNDERFTDDYDRVFGGPWRRRLVSWGNRLQARQFRFRPAWNAEFCKRVRNSVSIPVLAEGGIRTREHIDRLLGDDYADMVGMGRPFYAEPKLPARLLNTDDVAVLCESCNNCTVPQVTGARGVCRTPSVMQRRGELVAEGVYETI